MRDFIDRVPTAPNKKKITKEDGSEETVTIEFADAPTDEGTKLNRAAFMSMQGMENNSIKFGTSNITETFDTGVLTTTFNVDGSITETFVGRPKGLTITKTTTFNSDGTITVSVS